MIVVLDGEAFRLGEEGCLLELRTRTKQQIEGENFKGKDTWDPQEEDGIRVTGKSVVLGTRLGKQRI